MQWVWNWRQLGECLGTQSQPSLLLKSHGLLSLQPSASYSHGRNLQMCVKNLTDKVQLIGMESMLPLSRRKRTSKPKVKSGCFTCKARHLKCDEGKPRCQQCQRDDLDCEGYIEEKTPSEKPKPPCLAILTQLYGASSCCSCLTKRRILLMPLWLLALLTKRWSQILELTAPITEGRVSSTMNLLFGSIARPLCWWETL